MLPVDNYTGARCYDCGMKNLIAIDVETTGLDPLTSSIVSIGAVHIETRSEFYIECKPWEGAERHEGALKVNGFTNEQLDSFDCTEAQAVSLLIEWATSFTTNPIMLAHNSAFDKAFISAACKRGEVKNSFNFRTVDVHSIVYTHIIKKGDVPSGQLSLNKCLEYFGLPKEPDPHNALTGAKCNVSLWQKVTS